MRLLTGLCRPPMSGMRLPRSLDQAGQALRQQHGFDAIGPMPQPLQAGRQLSPHQCHVLPALIRRFRQTAERGDATVTCWGTGSPAGVLARGRLGEACVTAGALGPQLSVGPLDDAGQPCRSSTSALVWTSTPPTGGQ